MGGDIRRSERCLAGARGRTSKLKLFMYTSILGAQAAQVVGSGAWAVGELIGAVCEGHGRELLFQNAENRLPGAAKVNSRRSTFEYILKPEVVAIGGRRCGHHRSTV